MPKKRILLKSNLNIYISTLLLSRKIDYVYKTYYALCTTERWFFLLLVIPAVSKQFIHFTVLSAKNKYMFLRVKIVSNLKLQEILTLKMHIILLFRIMRNEIVLFGKGHRWISNLIGSKPKHCSESNE